MPDFEKELPIGSTLVLSLPASSTEKELYRIALQAISNLKIDNATWICYQKVPKDIISKLNSYGANTESINKIDFIDMLSNMHGFDQRQENTSYCPSPTEYNCLLRSIEHQCSKDGNRVFIFDNLNALMSYDMIERMIRFIRNLNNFVLNFNVPIIYLGISGGSSREIEISLQATMDNIHYLQENAPIHQPSITWDELKKTSWMDVFSLNAPLVFLLLVVMIVSNIILLGALVFLTLN